jgi:hypothetical protein
VFQPLQETSELQTSSRPEKLMNLVPSLMPCTILIASRLLICITVHPSFCSDRKVTSP